jgi:hypothetical protein
LAPVEIEERFIAHKTRDGAECLSARADAFAGSEREEKASARFVRNDSFTFRRLKEKTSSSEILRTWGAAVLRPYMIVRGDRETGGGRRSGAGEVESKPAPFQKRKGCGTQLPSRPHESVD